MAASRAADRRMNVIACESHPNADLIEDSHAGDVICSACGLVVGDRLIDVGSEWRTFTDDKNSKDASRVGAAENPLLGGSDLTTSIATTSKDVANLDEYGKPIYKSRRNISGSDRTLLTAFREISNMADKLNLAKIIVEKAHVLFKQIHDGKVLKGASSNSISSACLYIACRQEGVPRSFKEICAVSKVSKKEIGRTFKKIMKAQETSLELITTGDFMSRFCSNLGLSVPIQSAATYIAKKAAELDLVPGRSPLSVAAAAIFLASQLSADKRSQKEIGDIAGVAEVTIGKSYKQLKERAADLLPSNFVCVTPISNLPT